MAGGSFGSDAAQKIISGISGVLTADDEVRLLNGLLALGYDPARIAKYSDRDPSRRWLGDAVTRALNDGIQPDQIKKAIAFDQVARDEHDPVRRVQRLAEVLGVDMGRVGQIANARGGTPDAWIAAVEEVGRAGRVSGTQTLLGSDAALQTFGQYARSQQGTYIGKGEQRVGAAPTIPGAVQPPVWSDVGRPIEQQRSGTGGPPRPPAPAGPTISGQVPGAGAPAPGAGGPGAGGTPPPVKLTPEQIRADIESRYGWGAAFMDIPEIAKILSDAGNGLISAEEANRLWLGSNYYKETLATARQWHVLEKSSPAEAAQQLQGQVDSIITRANALGIDLDPARARQIAETSKRFGWSDQQIAASIASEAKYDPTGAKTGVMAQIKGVQQSMLVPLSDQAMTQWAQAIIGGTQTLDDFTAYMKDQAKSLFPSLATYLDQTPGGNVRTYLDPYAQTISETLGMPAGDIDWMDPKWFRFVNSQDKTGQRKTVDIADVQRTLIADPQYGFDQTTKGKQQKAGFARTILQDWGFLAGTEGGLR
jgi:hypothetical protein